MKAIYNILQGLRKRSNRMWGLGMGLGWFLAPLIVLLTDTWIGSNWVDRPTPGFLAIGGVMMLERVEKAAWNQNQLGTN